MRKPEDSTPAVHLNLNVRGLNPSATLAINEKCNDLRLQGRRVYKLGLGQSPFPVPLPVVEALKANAFQKDYLPVKGLPELRNAVADYHRRRHDIARTGDDILVGPGSKELMFLLQLVHYGDLLITTPSWVSYAPQAQIIGRRVLWLATTRESRWKLDPKELDEICWPDPDRPRILVLNYPNNPTGLTYSSEELRALADVARKYSIVLLSDEIYGELDHDGDHVSIARYYPEGTIISSGLSKWCGAGGWRLGSFTFPRGLRWLLDAMAVAASETFTSTSAPIQYAAVRAFHRGSEIEHYLFQVHRILASLGNFLAEALREAGVGVHAPQGAFYLFPDFSVFSEKLHHRGLHTSQQFCERLLADTGVALLPGMDFGRPAREFTGRLAYVDFDGAHALTAAEAISRDHPLDEPYLRLHCGGVLEAIDLICEWVR